MRTKFLGAFAALLMLAFTTNAQSKIAGVVKDSKQTPLNAVTVSLLNAKDSALIKADVTNANGVFEINTNYSGAFLLQFTGIGFDEKYSKIYNAEKDATINIDVETLTESTKKLQSVIVVAKKPLIEVKADKTIFNVEQSINASGSNALELLKKAPAYK